jgi:putative DNA primase/helicase
LKSNKRDTTDLNALLLDSALAAIEEDAPLTQIEEALRPLSELARKADPIRYAIVREAAIRLLRQAGIRSPVALVNAALQSTPSRQMRGPYRDVEPWPDAVDGERLLHELAHTFRRFVVLSSGAADGQALWVLHTYHPVSRVSPLLCIRSAEKRSGKTRNLEILSCLVHRPMPTASISVGALFRMIDQYRPTLLIDEADTVFRRNDELRSVLNAGLYRSNAFVIRCGREREEPRVFSVACPKAIALIGRLPSTLEDRSIVVSMKRRLRAEPVETFRYETISAQLEPLRRKAARWIADHRKDLDEADPVVPDDLHDRAQDLWRPLMALAEAAGGPWPKRALAAAIELSHWTREDTSIAVQLLQDIRALFLKHQAQRLSSEVVVRELASMEDRPWPDWRHGQPISKAQLARTLAPFDIHPKVLRLGGAAVGRGYLQEDFEDAFRRYGG